MCSNSKQKVQSHKETVSEVMDMDRESMDGSGIPNKRQRGDER